MRLADIPIVVLEKYKMEISDITTDIRTEGLYLSLKNNDISSIEDNGGDIHIRVNNTTIILWIYPVKVQVII